MRQPITRIQPGHAMIKLVYGVTLATLFLTANLHGETDNRQVIFLAPGQTEIHKLRYIVPKAVRTVYVEADGRPTKSIRASLTRDRRAVEIAVAKRADLRGEYGLVGVLGNRRVVDLPVVLEFSPAKRVGKAGPKAIVPEEFTWADLGGGQLAAVESIIPLDNGVYQLLTEGGQVTVDPRVMEREIFRINSRVPIQKERSYHAPIPQRRRTEVKIAPIKANQARNYVASGVRFGAVKRSEENLVAVGQLNLRETEAKAAPVKKKKNAHAKAASGGGLGMDRRDLEDIVSDDELIDDSLCPRMTKYGEMVMVPCADTDGGNSGGGNNSDDDNNSGSDSFEDEIVGCDNSDSGDKAFDFFHEEVAPGVHQWQNSYLLALAMHYIYPTALDGATDSQESFEAAFESKMCEFGLDEFTFVYDEEEGVDGVVMSNEKATIVVFRGTQMNGSDWSTNLQFFPFYEAEIEERYKSDDGNIAWHGGWWYALDAIYDDLQDALATDKHSGRPLWVTGHSLGGVMAVIGAYRLAIDGTQVEGVVTYGCPRPGNVPFKNAYNQLGLGGRTHRWMNYRDIVPRIPLWKPQLPLTDGSLAPRHVGDLHFIEDDGTARLYFAGGVIETSLAGASPHGTYVYCSLIRENMEAFSDDPGTELAQMPPAP